MSSTSLYLDWQFWSAIVAITALVLSQFPPVRVLFRKARLNCETSDRIAITHKVGNPNVTWNITLENTGGRTIRIKKANLTISKIGGGSFELPARTYQKVQDNSVQVLFTTFRLKPNDDSQISVFFFKPFRREEETEYRHVESEIRSDIDEKRKQLEDKSQNLEANPEIVKKIMDFFQRHYKWDVGEYELELRIVTDRQETNIRRQYRFSLFESDAEYLFNHSNLYKIGEGVYWDIPNKQYNLGIPVYER